MRLWLSSQRELSEAGLKGFGHLLTAGKFKVKGLKLLSQGQQISKASAVWRREAGSLSLVNSPNGDFPFCVIWWHTGW